MQFSSTLRRKPEITVSPLVVGKSAHCILSFFPLTLEVLFRDERLFFF
jgi:hypothetical protein